MKSLFASIIILMALSANAQLPNGTIAPNFNLTDINGNTHNLYEYLNEGKAVFIKFFACHCPSCWAYHNTGKLEDLYQSYGAPGTDQVVVLMIEYDEYNGLDEFNGVNGWTAGDWVTGTSFPQINPEGGDRTVLTNYMINYYPMIYKICPDKTTELMSINFSVTELYQKAVDCPGSLAIDDLNNENEVSIDLINHMLILSDHKNINKIEILNSLGQHVYTDDLISNDMISLPELTPGVYFIEVSGVTGVYTQKIYIQ